MMRDRVSEMMADLAARGGRFIRERAGTGMPGSRIGGFRGKQKPQPPGGMRNPSDVPPKMDDSMIAQALAMGGAQPKPGGGGKPFNGGFTGGADPETRRKFEQEALAQETGGLIDKQIGGGQSPIPTTGMTPIPAQTNQTKAPSAADELLATLGKKPETGEAKGDLRDALFVAGINMLRDNGNTSSWDAIANGAMAGFGRYDETKKEAKKKIEDEYSRDVERAKTGYQIDRDRTGDERATRQDDRLSKQLEQQMAEMRANQDYRNKSLGLEEKRMNKPTTIDQIMNLEREIGGTPQEVAARALERVRPTKQNRIDPGVAKWANEVLKDPMASGEDRAKAMRALGIDGGDDELEGLF